ncbi:MAG TPA: hypothetical protein VKR22_03165, partial [Acidimicrobiales bacterium]|nr:hypothetical protein [Acidimicrobiales bacterium]
MDDTIGSDLQKVSENYLQQKAGVMFVTAPTPRVPIIADPDIPPNDGSQMGDISVLGGFSSEYDSLLKECKAAWGQFAPSASGIYAINVRHFYNTDAVGEDTVPPCSLRAIQPPGCPSPGTPGARWKDLCYAPRHILPSDVETASGVGFDDPVNYLAGMFPGDPFLTIGHELGHALLLGHGNGLDDNHMAVSPTQGAGSRQYDTSYCNAVANVDAQPFSLMSPTSPVGTLTDFQIENLRDAAEQGYGVVPGGSSDPSGQIIDSSGICSSNCAPADIAPFQLMVARSTFLQETETTIESHGPVGAGDAYYALVDTDNDPGTGCLPSTLGVPTSFEGAELVTKASLEGGQPTLSAWACHSGAWQPISTVDGDVTPFDGTGSTDASGSLTVAVHDADIPPLSSTPRVAAVDVQANTGVSDAFPSDGGRALSLTPSPLPTCTVSPATIAPATKASVTAAALPPNVSVHFEVGTDVVANGQTDSGGGVTASFVLPSVTTAGPIPVVVGVDGSGIASGCFLNADVSPAASTHLQYTGPGSDQYTSEFTPAAHLTDLSGDPIAGALLTFTVNSSESCAGNTDASGDASCQLSPKEGVGSYPLTVDYSGTAAYLASEISEALQITPRPVIVNVTPPPVQYSDPLPDLNASFSTSGLAGTDLLFGTLAGCRATGLALNGALVWSSAGTYSISGCNGLSNPNYVVSYSGSLTVTREDAITAFSSGLFFSTGSATATSGPVVLNATVTQDPDGTLGDLGNVPVEFELFRS